MPNQPADLLIPPSLQRRVRTLGHGLYRLSEAWQLLAVRLDRGLLDQETAAWIRQWCGDDLAKPLPLPVDSALAAEIIWSGKAWQVVVAAGPQDAHGESVDLWASAFMLLHLPVLRSFWGRALRVQRFGWMAKVLPRVWALDTGVLRPGAVLAGLGIPSWQDLPRVMAAGRTFEWLPPAGGRAQPVDAAAWPGKLAKLKGQRVRLRERAAPQPDGRLTATWKHDGTGRIVLDQVR